MLFFLYQYSLSIYKNAQIILTDAREGRGVIKSEIGIEIEEKDQSQQQSSQAVDIFNKFKARKDQIPIRPLTEGRLECYMLLITDNITVLYNNTFTVGVILDSKMFFAL